MFEKNRRGRNDLAAKIGQKLMPTDISVCVCVCVGGGVVGGWV
jgi:hypothetical protein